MRLLAWTREDVLETTKRGHTAEEVGMGVFRSKCRAITVDIRGRVRTWGSRVVIQENGVRSRDIDSGVVA